MYFGRAEEQNANRGLLPIKDVLGAGSRQGGVRCPRGSTSRVPTRVQRAVINGTP